jgi:hypothetical protein
MLGAVEYDNYATKRKPLRHLDEEKTLGYEPMENSGDYQQRDTVAVWKGEVV